MADKLERAASQEAAETSSHNQQFRQHEKTEESYNSAMKKKAAKREAVQGLTILPRHLKCRNHHLHHHRLWMIWIYLRLKNFRRHMIQH